MEEFIYNLREGRIGRVPVWLAGIILAGAIVLFFWWRNRRINQSLRDQAAVEAYYEYPYDESSGVYTDPITSYLGENPTHPAYPIGISPKGMPGPITNEQWARMASDYLLGKGNDPILVQNALRKYLDGQPLTAAEQAIISLALQQVGSPPEGIIGVIPKDDSSGQPNPTEQPQPPEPQERRYVIVARYTEPNPPWNSTLWGIANRYGRTVDDLIRWNGLGNRPYVGGAPVIYTGERIWVDP